MKRKISFLRIILIPFSILYSLFMQVRNYLYDKNIISTCKESVKIISIGNITTGGTGKTPMVIYLSKLFLNRGKKVGIISRGYGRVSKDMITVYDGKSINKDISQTGDELALITFELQKEFDNNFFVVASADRCKASTYIENKFKPDVIILDDAFQHRKIHREIDIVLIDYLDLTENKFFYKFTIPSGDLREKIYNLKRADFLILNFKENNIKNNILSILDIDVPFVKIKYNSEYLIDYKNTILNIANKKAIIFSGISKPDSFLEALKKKGIVINKEIIFNDHHNYSQNDIDRLISFYQDDSVFITTGKDFVKVRNYKQFVELYPVYYLQLEIEVIKNSDLLTDLV